MFILPTQSDFREWQVWHYAKRLSETTDPKAKQFLSNNLKKIKNETR